MLEEIKKELINNPDKLCNVLEHFGYCNIVIHSKYISFGRDEYSSKKSIVINLENNFYLYVHDYARNIQKDIFSYIIDQRKAEFVDVLKVVKSILGISDYYDFFNKKGIFGGFYERMRKRKGSTKIHTYDESILDEYIPYGNVRFLKDHISLQAQRFFDIRYDTLSQAIVIPIRDQFGQLMGVKERVNYNISEDELKYYYSYPCQMSQTLYGYSQNYKYLVNNSIYIFESEKSVMQCFSYGIRNCVAIGSGTISVKQVKMLFELNPKQIIFMHDVGYKLEYINRNIKMVQKFSRFSEAQIGYWDFGNKEYENKVSPSDMGKDVLSRIIASEIIFIGESDEEL